MAKVFGWVQIHQKANTTAPWIFTFNEFPSSLVFVPLVISFGSEIQWGPTTQALNTIEQAYQDYVFSIETLIGDSTYDITALDIGSV